jgi:branched-chain amino acid transport system permease protein
MTARTIIILLIVLLLMSLEWMLPEFFIFQICLIASMAVIVLGLVVVSGLAGQVSLAQAAFVALGSYGAAILEARLGIPVVAGIPLAAILSGAVGYVLGFITLRVSGHYLALATMAFTAIVQIALINLDSWTGGAAGMAFPSMEVGGRTLSTANEMFYVIMPVSILMFVWILNIIRSRYGRDFSAIRESETAASAMGINVLRYKSMAFAMSAFLGAMGGGMLAVLSTYLDPAQYGILQSVHYLAVAVIGGVGTPLGAIIGSVIFTMIPELLQSFQSYLGLVFALLLLGFIVIHPAGVASLMALWSKPLRQWAGLEQRKAP